MQEEEPGTSTSTSKTNEGDEEIVSEEVVRAEDEDNLVE